MSEPKSLLDEPKTLYHYTSLAGLLGIVKDKSLNLSSIRHLNDSAEVSHATEIMRHSLPTIPKPKKWNNATWESFLEAVLAKLDAVERFELFVGSFSENRDQLSQWRAYSDGVGICIGFSRLVLSLLAKTQDFEVRKCTYLPETQRRTINALLHDALHTHHGGGSEELSAFWALRLLNIAPTFKHPSFSEESEWRLLSGLSLLPRHHRGADDFRVGKSMLVPFQKFDLTTPDGDTPITEIIIGPAPHMELSADSVVDLIERQGLKNVNVHLSEIPYRHW